MTPAHWFQIALIGLGYLWLGWMIYQEVRSWLLKPRRENMARMAVKVQHKNKTRLNAKKWIAVKQKGKNWNAWPLRSDNETKRFTSY